MKQLAARIKSRRGFTMTELLCALLVFALLASAVLVGIRTTSYATQKTTDFANAQVLASTLSTGISDELHYASGSQMQAGKMVFFSSTMGSDSWFSVQNGKIMLKDAPLIAASAYSDGLNIVSGTFSVKYENARYHVYFEVAGRDGAVLSTADYTAYPLNAQ